MSRFDNLNLSRLENIAKKPEPQPEIAGVTIRQNAKAIAGDEQQAVREILDIAIDEGKQFYRNGTKMLDCGESQAMALRQQYDAMPLAEEALDQVIGVVEAEQRHDYTQEIAKVALDARGVLTGVNGNLIPTGNALSNLASFAPDGLESGSRYNLNLWAKRSVKTGVFRTRNPQKDGTRSCYAVVTKRYTKFDIDDVARELKTVIPQDAKAEVFYDGARWSINVDLAPTFKQDEVAVGRVFRVRTKIKSADDKSSSVYALFQALRIRCINCTTITDSKLIFKRPHMGDVAGLFAEALDQIDKAMNAFSAKWSEANRNHIVDKATKERLTPEETFRRLIAHGYVAIPHVGKANLLAKLVESFNKEPGDGTSADINNAITRLAHEGAKEWKSVWYTEEVEEQAGKLLFNRVFALPELTEKQADLF